MQVIDWLIVFIFQLRSTLGFARVDAMKITL